jgi:hypothetical protein
MNRETGLPAMDLVPVKEAIAEAPFRASEAAAAIDVRRRIPILTP